VAFTINDATLTAPIRVVASAFGLFTRAALGRGIAAATDAEGNDITAARPAVAGDIVTLRGTGLGAEAGEPEVLLAFKAAIVATVTREENGIDLPFGRLAALSATSRNCLWAQSAVLPAVMTSHLSDSIRIVTCGRACAPVRCR
jgi:uncharacterized protein (TIGR03437 family)